METAVLALLIVAVLLIGLSFFVKNDSKSLENQIENFSISLMHEIYQLKKKVRILEEEALIYDRDDLLAPSTEEVIKKVYAYHEAGLPNEQIARLTALSLAEIDNLLSIVSET